MQVQRWAVYIDGLYHMTVDSKNKASEIAKRYDKGQIVLFTGELPEPKKEVRMAPALLKDGIGYKRSVYFYESEEEARLQCGKFFVSWPARPNKDGYYEVEVASLSSEVQGD